MILLIESKDILDSSKSKLINDLTLNDLKMTPYRIAEKVEEVYFHPDTGTFTYNKLLKINTLNKGTVIVGSK